MVPSHPLSSFFSLKYDTHSIIGYNCRFLQGAESDPKEVYRLKIAVERGKPRVGTTFSSLFQWHIMLSFVLIFLNACLDSSLFLPYPYCLVLYRCDPIGCNEQVVVRNYRRDGTVFWNLIHISPVCDAHGKVTNWTGLIASHLLTDWLSYYRVDFIVFPVFFLHQITLGSVLTRLAAAVTLVNIV